MPYESMLKKEKKILNFNQLHTKISWVLGLHNIPLPLPTFKRLALMVKDTIPAYHTGHMSKVLHNSATFLQMHHMCRV